MKKKFIHFLNEVSSKNLAVRSVKLVFNKRVLAISMGSIVTIALGSYLAADRETPKISSQTAVIDYGSTLSKSNLKISDNRDDKKDLIVKLDQSSLNAKKLGTYKVKVKATDSYSNTSVKTVKVKVVDRQAPVIKGNKTSNGYILAEAGGSSDLSKYLTIQDNVDGNLYKDATFSDTLRINKTGTQIIHVKVSDHQGNTTEKDLKFKIIDSKAPEFSIKKELNVNYGDTFNIYDYVKANDNYDGDVNVTLKNSPNTKQLGKQNVSLSAIDSSGHATSATYTFTIKDMSGPTIVLNEKDIKDSTLELEKGDSFKAEDLLKSVSDNYDGSMKNEDVKIESHVDTSKVGSYKVTYTATDQSGNTSVKTITVKVTDIRDQIIATGKSYIGVPYVFGGSTPSGFDCSGFTRYVFAKYGISLPRSAAQQYNATTRVSKDNLKKGDLVFFSNTYKSGISHVGIYIGDGQMVDASGSAVQIDDITTGYWASHYTSGGRIKS